MLRLECTTTRGYDVVITPHVLESANHALRDALDCERGLVVVDIGAEPAYGAALSAYLDAHLPGFAVLVVGASEEKKSFETVLEICATAQQLRLGRRDALVAVGGGVCCDLVSVAASLIRRGVPYVTVPTTLLAQVDAGIAVKGAVNFGGLKNYLGCFRPPARVLVDPEFLSSLPRAELRSGAAEMLKIALVRDRELVVALSEHGPELIRSGFGTAGGIGVQLIRRSVELMLEELGKDVYEESDLRRLVDFGHTFSTRLEELSGWRMRHGEAVAIDMALSSALAVELGLLPVADLSEILSLISRLDLPLSSPLLTEAAVHEAVETAVAHRSGALNLVVPTRVGRATFVERSAELPPEVIAVALRRVRTFEATHRRPHTFDGDVGRAGTVGGAGMDHNEPVADSGPARAAV